MTTVPIPKSRMSWDWINRSAVVIVKRNVDDIASSLNRHLAYGEVLLDRDRLPDGGEQLAEMFVRRKEVRHPRLVGAIRSGAVRIAVPRL